MLYDVVERGDLFFSCYNLERIGREREEAKCKERVCCED